MRTLVRGLGLIVLVSILCGASGCYSSIVAVAKCASKHKTCKSVEQDFAPGSTLRVRNDFGPILVSGENASTCEIVGRIYVEAPTKREAREIGEQVRIVAEPNDGTLFVTVAKPHLEKNRAVWVDLEIMVPSRAHVDCQTEFGRVKLVGIEGDIRTHTEFGPVVCEEITSGSITVKSEFGGINITCSDACPADLVADVRTDYGKIRFRAPEAFEGDIDMGTDFGSTRTRIPIAHYSEWSDDRKIATTGGGKGRLSLHTDFGSVRVK
jgi:hypothetical protein